jgi:hypothetical protein
MYINDIPQQKYINPNYYINQFNNKLDEYDKLSYLIDELLNYNLIYNNGLSEYDI